MTERRDRPLAGMNMDTYYELLHRCYRYKEWKREIVAINTSLNPTSGGYDGMPHTHNMESLVEKKAVRLAMLQGWVDEIEEAARRASHEFAPCIIKYCSDRNLSFEQLQQYHDIPCSRTTFYRYRALFFQHLLFIRETNGT